LSFIYSMVAAESPEVFWITMVQPYISCRRVAIVRAVRSCSPPAEKGTMTVIAFSGYPASPLPEAGALPPVPSAGSFEGPAPQAARDNVKISARNHANVFFIMFILL
jgi:hypothetical protein